MKRTKLFSIATNLLFLLFFSCNFFHQVENAEIRIGSLVGSQKTTDAVDIGIRMVNLTHTDIPPNLFSRNANTLGLPMDRPDLINVGDLFQGVSYNTGSNVTNAEMYARRLFDDDNVIGIVGPSPSRESIVVSAVCTEKKRPMVSFGSTSSQLSDKSEFPYFMRVIPPDFFQAQAIVDLCYSLELQNIGILATNESYGIYGARDVISIGKEKGVKINRTELFDPTASTTAPYLQRLKSAGVRVVIAVVSSAYSSERVLTDANTEGMLGEGFLWIFTDSYSTAATSLGKPGFEMLTSLSQGIFYVDLGVSKWVNRQYFLTQWAYIQQQTLQVKVDQTVIQTLLNTSPFAFDAVLCFAYAQKDLRENPSLYSNIPHSGDKLLKALKNVDFLGATGRVTFDENGDRLGVGYRILNIDGYSAKQVSSWSSETGLIWERTDLLFPGPSASIPTNPGGEILQTSITDSNRWYPLPKIGTSPSKRYGYSISLNEDDDEFYIFGGSAFDQLFNDLWRFNFKSSTWSQVFPLGEVPVARYEHVTFFIDEKLYLFGGYDSRQFRNDLYSFDLNTFSWFKVVLDGEKPSPRRAPSSFSYNGKAHVFGGESPIGEQSDIWRLDLDNSTWTQIKPRSDIIPPSRYLHCADVSGNHLIVFAGKSDTNVFGMNDIWVFNLDETDTQHGLQWRKLTTSNTPSLRFGCSCSVKNIYFYMTSGSVSSYSQVTLNDFYRLDISTLENTTIVDYTWQLIRDPIPNYGSRGSTSMVTFAEYMLWFGGSGEGQLYNDIWRYNTVTEAFEQINSNTATPASSTRAASCKVADQMLVFGGATYGKKYLASLYSLNGFTEQWRLIEPSGGSVPLARTGHTVVCRGEELVLFGGITETGTALNDLWKFSMLKNVWEKIDYFGDPSNYGAIPSPRSRHAAASNDTHMFIFGGRAGVTLHTDMWIFDYETYQFQMLNIDLPFTQNIDCRMQHIDHMLVLSGCIDQGDYPMPVVFTFDLRTPNVTWVSHYSTLYSGTTMHSLTPASSNVLLMYGGRIFTDLTNDLLKLTLNNSEIHFEKIVPGASPTTPERRDSHVAEMFGNKLAVFGGTGTLPGRVAQIKSTIFEESWSYQLGPVCSDITEYESECTKCAKGSFEYKGICQPCALGTFADEDGLKECKPCPAGFFGPFMGGHSELLCIPCPAGTYNNETGRAECTPCDAGYYCPIGSQYQDSSNHTITTEESKTQTRTVNQPPPIPNTDKKILFITATSIGIAAGVAIVFMLTIFLLWRIGICSPTYIQALDFFFSERHNTQTPAILIRKRTEVGGLFTFLAIALVSGFIIVESFTFAWNNDIEIRSVVPLLYVSNTQINATFLVNVTLVGYVGRCVASNTATLKSSTQFEKCSTGISVGMKDFNAPADLLWKTPRGKTPQPPTELSCKYASSANTAESNCTVQFICRECYFKPEDVNGTLTFQAYELRSFANRIEYSFNVSTGYLKTTPSNLQYSSISGFVEPEENKMFRGIVKPTSLRLETVPSVFKVVHNNYTAAGYYIDFGDTSRGDQVSSDEFNHRNGVSFQFIFDKTLYALSISRQQKRDTFKFIMALLSRVTGVIAAIAAVMAIAEMVYNMYVDFSLLKEDRSWFTFIKSQLTGSKDRKNIKEHMVRRLRVNEMIEEGKKNFEEIVHTLDDGKKNLEDIIHDVKDKLH